MTFEEIKSLIQLINKSDLAEFRFEEGEQKIVIRTSKFSNVKQQSIHTAAASPSYMPMTVSTPVAPVSTPKIEDLPKSAPATVAETAPVATNYLEIKSPIVGTFYRSAGTDKPPYTKIGDTIDKGKVVCIIEAMKLFNEIESEVKGKIMKVCVEDATPVEYGQVLFLVEP